MNDPIFQAAVELKKATDDLGNPEVSRIMNDIMETLLDAAVKSEPAPEVKSTGCAYCDREIARGNTFYPPHNASSSCRSGGRNHCSCDTCF